MSKNSEDQVDAGKHKLIGEQIEGLVAYHYDIIGKLEGFYKEIKNIKSDNPEEIVRCWDKNNKLIPTAEIIKSKNEDFLNSIQHPIDSRDFCDKSLLKDLITLHEKICIISDDILYKVSNLKHEIKSYNNINTNDKEFYIKVLDNITDILKFEPFSENDFVFIENIKALPDSEPDSVDGTSASKLHDTVSSSPTQDNSDEVGLTGDGTN